MKAVFDTLETTMGYDHEVLGALNKVDKLKGMALSEKPQKLAMKFTYPSGSKPLSGYTIKRGVGTGGFGEVYFAVSDAGKEVALKKIQRHLDIELRGVSHCLNLKHPNLISLYDVRYDDEGQAWVVMEYVGGPNMRSSLDSVSLDSVSQGFSIEETLRWFAGLAAGVAHLHDAGIVHRDLKPGNVFDDDGIVKIGDYGLSKYISCSQRGGHTESIGTFHYMAPEVGRGTYGREIDIYAMGIILFEMLTGAVPFDGESSQEIVMKHLTDNPDLRGVAEPYRGVIWQAMQKNPKARQRSVAQMVRPLGIEIDSQGIARIQTLGSSPTFTRATLGNSEHWPEQGRGEDIHFVGSPTATRPGNHRHDDLAPAELRFGEVRYHAPSPVAAAPSASLSWGQPGSAQASAKRMSHPGEISSWLGGLRNWWESLEAAPGAQTAILIVGCVVLLLNPWLMTFGIGLGLAYAVYVLFRSIFGKSPSPHRSMTGNPAVSGQFPTHQAAQWTPRATPRPMTVKQWIAQRRPALTEQKRAIKMADFFWSATVAVIVSCLIGAVSVWGFSSAGNFVDGFPYAVVAGCATGLLGAIALLAFGKVWECESKSSFSRRTILLGIGAAVGLVGFLISNYLHLLPGDLREYGTKDFFPDGTLKSQATSEALLWMGHYAVVFVLLRWWLNTDPLRIRRLSVWRIAVALVVEWVVQQFAGITQPVGLASIFIIAVATQFAAPWENPKARLKEVNRRLLSA